MTVTGGGDASLEAWQLVRRMLDDMTTMVREDAETELELIEGLRVLARVTALCSELSVDVDPERPWFFPMSTEARFVGGPNPDGEYYLGMIDGSRRYRIHGNRGTSAYLGFQVLAGVGLTPRRHAAYLSDRDLSLGADGSFSIVLSTDKPTDEELGDGTWLEIPADSSGIVVREYIADRRVETLATVDIESIDPAGTPPLPTDEAIGLQLTGMAWTIAKLATLHRSVMPELMGTPNQLVTATSAQVGAADSTPDNLYMLGMFRLDPGESLVLDISPPSTRYWTVTLENIWHECIDPRRRRSSVTNAHAVAESDGTVRVVIAAEDPGVPNWLDTGGRHRGFMTLRWLDNPDPPPVRIFISRNVAVS